MAKSKDDYFKDGERVAREFHGAGKLAATGRPCQTIYGKPLPVMVGSWQALAFWDGFDAFRNALLLGGNCPLDWSPQHGDGKPARRDTSNRVVGKQRARTLIKRGERVTLAYHSETGKPRYLWTMKK